MGSCENGTEPSGLAKAGNFFSKCESIRFLRWTLPHAVDMFCETKLYRVFTPLLWLFSLFGWLLEEFHYLLRKIEFKLGGILA